MDRIISYLATYLSFLWRGGRYQIVSAESAASNGGDAVLIVASDQLRLRFVCDRRQLFLDFQSALLPKAWYSIDLVRGLLSGEDYESAVLGAEYAEFLQTRFDEIERRFAPERCGETMTALAGAQRLGASKRW